jgi:hypothetical protein
VDAEFLTGARDFVAYMRPRLDMYRQLVTDNIILRKRLEGIGPIDAEMCRKYGATGPVIRGAGVANDVRRVEPYSVYPSSISRSRSIPSATAWRGTWCGWRRWSRACGSWSRPSPTARGTGDGQGAEGS